MALQKNTLEEAFRTMPSSTLAPPAGNIKAAEEISKVLEKYFREATAGAAIVTLSATALVPLVKPTLDSNTFLQKLGTTIQGWAATWVWKGPGVAGAPGSTIVVGPLLDNLMIAFIAKSLADKSNPPKDNTAELASIIDKWAKTPTNIVANLINSTGTVIPTPVA